MKLFKYIFKISTIIFIITLILTSCTPNEQGENIKYFFNVSPKNLDPQTASEKEELLIVENIMEGLMSTDEKGEVGLGLAKNYSVSPNGLAYEFVLKDDIKWVNSENKKQESITSQDFLFSFKRIIELEKKQPTNVNFYTIKNMKDIINGEKDISEIGIEIKDGKTIVFHLEKPDPNILDALASPAAVPCNEKFFLNTEGQYGLTSDNMLYSGPYILNYWIKENYSQIRKNKFYYDYNNIVTEKITFPLADEKSSSKDGFLKNNNDFLEVSGQEINDFNLDEILYYEYMDSVWALIFNKDSKVLNNKKIRDSFKLSINIDNINTDKPFWITQAKNIIPPDTKIGNDNKYSDLINENLINFYNPDEAKKLFNEGLNELELSSLPKTEIIYPENDFYTLLMQQVQKNLQENLSIFVNIRPVSNEEIEKLYNTNTYDIIFKNIMGNPSSPYYILNNFSHFYSNDSDYINFLNEALSQSDNTLTASLFYNAEKKLVDDSLVYPVLHQSSFKMRNALITNVVYSKKTGNVLFKYIKKEK